LWLSTECIKEDIGSGRSYELYEGSVTISNCVFQRLEPYYDNGGVIYINVVEDNGLMSINIDDTTFAKCKVDSGWGGAIYLYQYYQIEFSLVKICVFCCEAQNGNFMPAEMSLGNQNIEFLSIA